MTPNDLFVKRNSMKLICQNKANYPCISHFADAIGTFDNAFANYY